MPNEINIIAEEAKLEEIFGDEYMFEIPDFQRPYVWTLDQAGEMYEDISNALEEANDPSIYFLGSIVLIKSKNDPKAIVIDGQQRLITLTILICVLRDLAKEKTKPAFDKFVKQEGNEITDKQDTFRVKVHRQNTVWFENNIQNLGSTDNLDTTKSDIRRNSSRKRMHENASYFRDELSKLSEDKRKAWAKHMLQNCVLVVISTQNLEAAHRVFSVINTRGLSLLPIDILKADLIGELHGEEARDCTEKWENIEVELGREAFHELFQHLYMIKKHRRPNKSSSKEYKSGVVGGDSGDKFITEVLPQRAQDFKAVKFNDDDEILPKETNRSLQYLRLIPESKMRDWIPVAMECLHVWRSNHSELSNSMREVERLAYWMYLNRMTRDQRVKRWAKILKTVQCGEVPAENGLSLNETERRYFAETLNGEIDEDRRRTLLLRLDGLLADTGAKYYHGTISVEHVLPQNPPSDSKWLQDFPNKENRIRWTNRIANLVLLSRRKNSKASNYDFQRKKDEYFRKGNVTPFALTTEVLDEPEWALATLERRQADLLGRLKREWRLD